MYPKCSLWVCNHVCSIEGENRFVYDICPSAERKKMKKTKLIEKDIQKISMYGFQEEFIRVCECICYPAGEKIVEERMPISKLLIILDGQVKVCMSTSNGRNLILCYYLSEGLLGDMEYLRKTEEAEATVVAISDVRCLAIPYDFLSERQKENTVFLLKLAEEMAEKLTKSTENYLMAAVCTGEERLCNYILKNSPRRIFADVLTDVSCSVGMSYRHMFRLIHSLCEEQVLEKRQNGYYILNLEELIRRAGEGCN